MRYSITYDKEAGKLAIEIPVTEILYATAKGSVLSDDQIHLALQNPVRFIQKLMDSLSADNAENTLIEQMIEQAISQTIGDDI